MAKPISIASLATATALLAGTFSAAFAAGTEQQRQACMPDAFKLCAASMPDEGQVESCLRAAGPRLSAACHEVFYPQSASNQMQTRGQAPQRDRMQPSAPERLQVPSSPQMPPRTINDDDD